MTQRIFDIENEKDMADLWEIVPDEAEKARKVKTGIEFLDKDNEPCLYIHDGDGGASIIKINWHNKTEITRPIQEVTEQDIGKICMFSYPQEDVSKVIGILRNIKKTTDGKNCYKMYGNRLWYIKCRRLTKKEIEELC